MVLCGVYHHSQNLGFVAFLVWEAQLYFIPLESHCSWLLEEPHGKGNGSTNWTLGDYSH